MRPISALKLLFGTGLPLALLGSTLVFWSENTQLKSRLHQSDELFRKMQQEAGRLESEKAQIAHEYDTLQNDVIAYVAQNTKLQEASEQLQKRVTDAEEQLKEKDAELQRVEGKFEKLHKDMMAMKMEKRNTLTKELTALTQKVASLESDLKHERSLSQYNLGVVYAQAQRDEEAMAAYQKSLAFDPKNAEAHYNLGLLYEQVTHQPDKAVWHYRQYLEQHPKAEDRDEVQRRIEKLMGSVKSIAPTSEPQP